MSSALTVKATVDVETERLAPIYSCKGLRQMFAIAIFRCPSCGSTGKAGSWCEGHSAPMECGDVSLRVQREPVLIPHAEPERTVSETYEREAPFNAT